MTTRYRLLDTVKWEDLHGTKVQIEVSEHDIIAMPLKPGASFIMLAQAVKPRGKANGQPPDDGVPEAETVMAREIFDA